MKKTEGVSHTPSLIDVQLAFAQWRKTRTVRGPTPERLRKLAVAQMEHHRAAAVYKALDLNAATLKQWAEQFKDIAPNERDASQDFIALSSDVPSTKTPCQLSLTLPNGVQLKV